MPSFKNVDDNSLNDFFDFPDISLSNNPIYKYKYPKLSTGKTIKQEWQSQVGTPNELNRFRRQDETGKSLEVIKEEDNVYASGLKQIQDMIDEDTKQLKNDYNGHLKIIKSSNETDQEKEARIKTLNEEKENIETQKKSKNEKTLNKYRKRNPVFIKPVIQKSEEEIEKSKEEFIKRSEAR